MSIGLASVINYWIKYNDFKSKKYLYVKTFLLTHVKNKKDKVAYHQQKMWVYARGDLVGKNKTKVDKQIQKQQQKQENYH